jgi:hypothetical protein
MSNWDWQHWQLATLSQSFQEPRCSNSVSRLSFFCTQKLQHENKGKKYDKKDNSRRDSGNVHGGVDAVLF